MYELCHTSFKSGRDALKAVAEPMGAWNSELGAGQALMRCRSAGQEAAHKSALMWSQRRKPHVALFMTSSSMYI